MEFNHLVLGLRVSCYWRLRRTVRVLEDTKVRGKSGSEMRSTSKAETLPVRALSKLRRVPEASRKNPEGNCE